MFNFIKNILKKNPKYESTHTLFTELPLDIQQMSRLYPDPSIGTIIGNKADGEIRLFSIENNKLRVGQALFLKNDKEVWVHLGCNYFKNTLKL